MSRAPISPDLNPEDYIISLQMWQPVHQTKFHNAKPLNQRMLDIWRSLKQSVNDDMQLMMCMYLRNRTTLFACSLLSIMFSTSSNRLTTSFPKVHTDTSSYKYSSKSKQ